MTESLDINLITTSPGQTQEVGKIIGQHLDGGDCVLLDGELGAGKTTLIQAIAKAMGVKEDVTSPSFTLVNPYDGKIKLYHLDLYRLDSESEILNLDIDRYWGDLSGITLIEWAEKLGSLVPNKALKIKLDYADDPKTRTLNISTTPEFNSKRFLDLKKTLQNRSKKS